ncbi:ABC transporter substrate-binding protein [Arthrobacter bambusae]|uniref:NitT/TauT family transport system substrate-binding protein n=1 Tax=Arthrobacter bambusae TaxID=1338426 RepID=A0AAW8DDZ0_9MICC|nr:ABC transporter substrate-binding protein [Arthrobacter bambusae]MDP9905993.1 NitT/TauT family transport system substrate-binding protein [Arthrobacter bambusae]MDQ0130224.1 NitT/TauT family transport system substrate-binding protein [Arthrobacter bambusae]MDQ0181604.1 NitT/TauT family transport system substrate-binding protein [Arthrobacter bambusae]
MMKNKIYAVGAAGVIALSLAACGTSTASSNSTASGSAAADTASMPTVKLMVGGIDKQIYLPYQLAEQLGFYQKYGVKMELSTESQGGVGAEDAMASGQVDMAGAWYVHTVDFQSKGKNVINLVQLSSAPGERIMCNPKANVKTGADLKGKTVGVTDLGSGTDELTQFIAAKAGLAKSDYHTIAVGAGATAIAAIQRGSADCVMTTQPTVGALENKNLAVSAIDLATSDGAKAALGGTLPSAGLLAQSDWVKTHEDAAQKVVNALVDTMHWISTHSAQEIADKLPQSYVQNSTISKDQYVAALNQDKGQFLPDGIMPAGGPKTIFDEEKTIGVDTSKVNVADTFTQKYAQAALKLEGYTAATTPAGNDG